MFFLFDLVTCFYRTIFNNLNLSYVNVDFYEQWEKYHICLEFKIATQSVRKICLENVKCEDHSVPFSGIVYVNVDDFCTLHLGSTLNRYIEYSTIAFKERRWEEFVAWIRG